MTTGTTDWLNPPGINIEDADNRYLRATDMIYGIRIDTVNDEIQPGILVGGEFIPMEYSSLPVHEDMRRGLLTDTTFTALHATDSTKLADGTAATLDGSAGQVMVEKERYNKLTAVDGQYQYLMTSKAPFWFRGVQSWVPPCFGDAQYIYFGAFQGTAMTDAAAAVVGSVIKDTSGYTTNVTPNPVATRTRAQFRAQVAAGGEFFQMPFGFWEVICDMAYIEYKTFDMQTALPGYTAASAWDYAHTRPAGRTLGLGNGSGSILVDLAGVDSDLVGVVAADKYVANSYRGIENIFGNVYVFLDGINIDNRDGSCHVYVCHDPDNFADDTVLNYVDTGHAPGFAELDGYIKSFAFKSADLTYYPAEINGGADSASFITDYHYNAAGAWRVLCCGGSLSAAAFAGLAYLYAYCASSAANATFSVRPAAKRSEV